MSDQRESELTELEALVQLAKAHDFDALTLKAGELEIEIVRRSERPVLSSPLVSEPILAQTTSAPEQSPVAPVSSAQIIEAPIVGVFYRAASPGAPPFVNVGDRVAVGQVLCILEAMKLMNEITSDYSGVITAIGPENGALVTIGTMLYSIAPNG